MLVPFSRPSTRDQVLPPRRLAAGRHHLEVPPVTKAVSAVLVIDKYPCITPGSVCGGDLSSRSVSLGDINYELSPGGNMNRTRFVIEIHAELVD